jgi:glutaredoxin 3
MIKVYSTTWCAFCHAAMEYFDKIGVKYESVDVEKDQEAAREMIEATGQMGVPVIDLDGTFVVGFDKKKIDEILHDKKLT